MKKLLIIIVMIAALCVGVIASVNKFYDHCDTEYYWGEGDTFLIAMCNQLPSHIFHTIEGVPGVMDVINHTRGTLVYLNMSEVSEEPQAIIDYIDGMEYVLTRNKRIPITFPGYQFPECHWDYGTSQKIGVYWYNGNPYVIQDDPKC